MYCPVCHSPKTMVMEYLQVKHWIYVVTRRMCQDCGRIYSTEAVEDHYPQNVAKSNEEMRPRAVNCA